MQLLICNVNVIRRGWYSWLHLLRYDWVCEINNVKLHTRRPSLAWCAWAHQVQTVYDDAPMSGRHCSTVSGGTLVTSLWDRTTTASSFGCQPYQLTVPPHRRTIYGGRAFAVAGQSTWNSLPKRLRDPSSSSAVFARLLKAFLFSSNVSKRIRGFSDDALYKSMFYITLHYTQIDTKTAVTNIHFSSTMPHTKCNKHIISRKKVLLYFVHNYAKY